MGELIVGKSEPYKYLIDSIKKFYDQEEFSEQIQNQNFTNVTYKNLNAGVVAIHSAIKL